MDGVILFMPNLTLNPKRSIIKIGLIFTYMWWRKLSLLYYKRIGMAKKMTEKDEKKKAKKALAKVEKKKAEKKKAKKKKKVKEKKKAAKKAKKSKKKSKK